LTNHLRAKVCHGSLELAFRHHPLSQPRFKSLAPAKQATAEKHICRHPAADSLGQPKRAYPAWHETKSCFGLPKGSGDVSKNAVRRKNQFEAAPMA
jgi:hypothetical protein